MPIDAQQFRAENLLDQAMIQDLTISPDGANVAFSLRVIEDGRYRSHLWLVPFSGGTARQLTNSASFDRHPQFSPDGESILFLSDRSGSFQPWLLPMNGGDATRLSSFPGNTRTADWSPDGSRVLVVALSGEERFIVGSVDDPTARHITDFTWRRDGYGIRDQFACAYVVSAKGGDALRLTDASYEVAQAFWSPDGSRIGFLADLRSEASLGELTQVWEVAADGTGKPSPVAQLGGSISAAMWSPDGSTIASIGIDFAPSPNWANLNLYVHKDGNKRQLGRELDRPLGNHSFGDLIDPAAPLNLSWIDEQHVLALVSDGGRSLPYSFSISSDQEAVRLADGEYICTSFAAVHDRIAVVATNLGQPAEVYAVEQGLLRQLTTIGSSWLTPFQRDPRRILIEQADGQAFDAWFIEARGNPRPGPLAVQVHGGPHGAHGPAPWLEMLALADAGIHVLYANPRGSSGYGENFTKSVHGAFGDLDGDDQLRMVDWAIETGIADAARVGIFGLSYGGFMTTWLMGHAPGRFAAGVSENPLANAISWYGSNDLVDWTDERFMGVGRLPEDINAFLTRSPFMEIHNNSAPLLLLQAEQDLRCPPQDSDILFAILKRRGCTVEMVRYPGEPHYLAGVGRPDRRVDRINRIVDWFQRYL